MTYVPGFDFDVFVSYAHGDDREWIRGFWNLLQKELVERLGNKPSPIVWIDQDVSKSHDFRKAIPRAVKHSAVFLLLASTNYVKSDYCVRQECKAFNDTVESNHRKRFRDTSFSGERFVFRCLIRLVADNLHWNLFEGITDIPLCDNGGTFQLGSRQFKDAVRDLLNQLEALLRNMRNHTPSVFLYPHHPSPELKGAYTLLAERLFARGWRPLPDHEVDHEGQLREALASVFLLGKEYLEDTAKFVEIAYQQNKPCLVCRSPEATRTGDHNQVRFCGHIEKLNSSDNPSFKVLDLRMEFSGKTWIFSALNWFKAFLGAIEPTEFTEDVISLLPSTFETALESLAVSRTQEEKNASRATRNLWVLITTALVFAALAGVTGYEWMNARKLGILEFVRQLDARSESLAQKIDLEPAGLVATEAMERLQTVNGVPRVEADRALRNVVKLLPHETALFHHEAPVRTIAFSSDGRYLATGSEDNTARVFETVTRKEVFRFKHQGPVVAAVFSPDGRHLATASWDRTACVLEVASGKVVSRVVHQGAVVAVAFSPDGRYLATASWDKTARVLEVASGKVVSRVVHQGAVVAVAFSPDGSLVATGSADKTVRVFKGASGKEVFRLTQQNSVRAVAFSADKSYLATGSDDNTARVFEAATGKEVSRLTHQDAVTAVAFSPDGRYVATASSDNTARVFEAATAKEVSRLTHQDAVAAVAFSPDGRYVATASSDNTARVFEAATGKEVARLTRQDAVVTVVFRPDGHYVAAASRDKTVHLFEVPNGDAVSHLAVEATPAALVAFSGDDRYVCIVSFGSAQIFEIASGKEVGRIISQGVIVTAALNIDGRYVAVSGLDNTVRIFEVITGKEVAQVTPQSTAAALAFSSDGGYVVTAGLDNIARVFEIPGGREIANLPNQANVTALALSNNGHYVVIASEKPIPSDGRTQQRFDLEGTARVFEVARRKEVAYLSHPGPTSTVAFSPDGRYVAMGGLRTATVFEVAGGKEVSEMAQPTTALRFSPEDGYLFTAFFNGKNEITVKRHLLLSQDLVTDACSRFSRNLTLQEWQNYIGKEVSYHKTCPNLP